MITIGTGKSLPQPPNHCQFKMSVGSKIKKATSDSISAVCGRRMNQRGNLAGKTTFRRNANFYWVVFIRPQRVGVSSCGETDRRGFHSRGIMSSAGSLVNSISRCPMSSNRKMFQARSFCAEKRTDFPSAVKIGCKYLIQIALNPDKIGIRICGTALIVSEDASSTLG